MLIFRPGKSDGFRATRIGVRPRLLSLGFAGYMAARKLLRIATVLLLACIAARHTTAQARSSPLRLIQTISIPNVEGRLDHMDVDVAGQRLFVSGLENGSVEVIDLKAGTWLRSISGFRKPQGVVFVPSLNKLFVASGDDGSVRVFRGSTFELLHSIQLDLGANRVIYDPRKKLLYVGYGGKDAGKNYGEVGILNAESDKEIGDIEVSAHPAELLLNSSGTGVFVFISSESRIQLVNLKAGRIVSTWPVSAERPGDGAFDETTQRLFVGTHTPAELIVLDSTSGREVFHLPTVEGMDGVYFDSIRKRIYISGGREEARGSVYVYQQKEPDHYEIVAMIPTRPGAGTSFWSPELNRYYVAAPAHAGEQAAILVFEPID